MCDTGPETYLIRTKENGDLISYREIGVGAGFGDNNRPISAVERNGTYYVLGRYFDAKKHNYPYNSGEYFYFTSFTKKSVAPTASVIPNDLFALQKFQRENNMVLPKVYNYNNIGLFKNNSLTSYTFLPQNTTPIQSLYIEKFDSLGRTCPDFTIPKFRYDTSTRPLYVGQEIKGAKRYVDTLAVVDLDISLNDIHINDLLCSEKMPVVAVNELVSESSVLAAKAKIYPNPTKDVLNISFYSYKMESTQITIAGLDGKVLKAIKMNTIKGIVTQFINVAALAKGVYFVTIISGNKQTILKFLKE